MRKKKIKKISPAPDVLTCSEQKRLQMIKQIQSMHQKGMNASDISRKIGVHAVTVGKYLKGDPERLCHDGRKGKSMLCHYQRMILEKLGGGMCQAEIIRHLCTAGYKGSETAAKDYIRELRRKCPDTAPEHQTKNMPTEYISRAGIFNHIWLGIELTDGHKSYLWGKYPVLYEICRCVSEFRKIFRDKKMALLYLYIERYEKSPLKEIATFAKGLHKDISAVENAVASEKSNGFVEGTNSRLKMVKRTMYGRCGIHLLAAKLMYKK